jgi:hypothetical protein
MDEKEKWRLNSKKGRKNTKILKTLRMRNINISKN